MTTAVREKALGARFFWTLRVHGFRAQDCVLPRNDSGASNRMKVP
jgi:hypothetical protein